MTVYRLEPSFQIGGGPAAMLYLPEAASQTAVVGNPVKISSGYISAISSEVGTATSSKLCGILTDDGHNDTSAGTHKIGFVASLPNQTFLGCVHYASSATNAKIAATDLGATWGLKKTGTKWYVNKAAAATKKCVKVIELVDAVGTTNGRVRFVIRGTWQLLT